MKNKLKKDAIEITSNSKKVDMQLENRIKKILNWQNKFFKKKVK
jgi:hypothetical protein|tara:strand:+ start:1199 stop:1330 length:132 start_codon:yes stop_codon:yes gene_type:complete